MYILGTILLQHINNRFAAVTQKPNTNHYSGRHLPDIHQRKYKFDVKKKGFVVKHFKAAEDISITN